MSKAIALTLALAFTSGGGVLAAAQFKLTPVVVAAYDTAFNPLPEIDTRHLDVIPRIFEIDLQVTTSDL